MTNRQKTETIRPALCPRSASGIFLATIVSLLWFSALAVRAADRYVSPPGGYGTNDTAGGYTNWLGAATNIQWALDKSANGETIWVTNGTYYLTNEISVSKSVLLQGVNGQEKTFINGNYPAYTNRCLNINNAGAVITGFTIMNAFGPPYSGGVAGGGVLIGVGTLRNCNITTNIGAWGGGVYISGAARIYDCIISSNSVITYGGGIAIMGVGAVISNCVLRGNYTAYRGGGVFVYGAVTDNRSETFLNCTFTSNTSVDIGGGVYNAGANSIYRNCVFFGNKSGNMAGGMEDIYADNTKIQNCTFVRNIGPGLDRYACNGGLVENCIIVSNSYASSAITTNLNNRTDSTLTLGVNAGNITNNPLFVNYSADNYRLANNSPCVNTGTNENWMTNSVDLDGRMRIRYGIVDMGAYERIYQGTIFTGR